MLSKSRSRLLITFALGIGLMLPLLAITPGAALGQDEKTKGKWEPKIPIVFPNVPIHTHVLPNGKVLFWGRREKGEAIGKPTTCQPWVWDPEKEGDAAFEKMPQPQNGKGEKYNLFCSGHTFLADGRLLVVGGHVRDGSGQPYAIIFDNIEQPDKPKWTPIDTMNAGRWYPTAVTLADGSVLVNSGSQGPNDKSPGLPNPIPQIIDKDGKGKWKPTRDFDGLPLYPRMHVAPDRKVLMNGAIHGDAITPAPNQFEGTFLLDTTNNGTWTRLNAPQQAPVRDYFSSVMYEPGKVLIAGGGLPPLMTAEIIDLNDKVPSWKSTTNMSIGRRHHNATILPDGTVLVTGGTSGSDGGNKFDDETKPVFHAELWDPKGNKGKGKWTVLAKESVPRLYHSTAVLLPDGRVLSAGGGEYALPAGSNNQNDPKNTHRDAQIFSPPYLCQGGQRPSITKAPTTVKYKKPFEISTPEPDQVGQVTWIRLSSVTHAFNQNQRINFLSWEKTGATTLSVTAPSDGNVCPPGHYMLFVLNKNNIPSKAKIMQILQ